MSEGGPLDARDLIKLHDRNILRPPVLDFTRQDQTRAQRLPEVLARR